MKPQYTTISERLEMKDQDMAKIMDHIERQTAGEIVEQVEMIGCSFFIGNNIHISFRTDTDRYIQICPGTKVSNGDCIYGENIIEMPMDIFSANVVGLWVLVKNYLK